MKTMTPNTATTTTTAATTTATTPRTSTTNTSNTATAPSRLTIEDRTANLTLETPILGAALAGLLWFGTMLPELALVLLGIPAAATLGVGALGSVARLLAQ